MHLPYAFRLSTAICLLTCLVPVSEAARRVEQPLEAQAAFKPAGRLDGLVLRGLKRHGLEPTGICSDAVFVRRVYLDLTGTLPEPAAVKRFIEQRDPRKRSELIDRLMEREEFADYWTLKWCDLLRVKSEFPINLWPNGVQAYAAWIHQAIKDNKPYDQFARELLTSSGSNFRVPAVNFYRGVQGEESSALASAAALTFMGARADAWSDERREGFEAFFSRVSFKHTAEWKEVIVFSDPAASNVLHAVFPDGRAVDIPPDRDPRVVFADWLITRDNPWFARSIVNRSWSWFMGRGIVHEPDDFRPDNPAVYPELLDYLAAEIVKADYDMRHCFRLILNSATYQQSSVPKRPHPDAERLFAHYPVRRLDAEVLIDALCGITGTHESYSSAIPEPFTFVPERHRTVELVDGSITSQFLKMFGRPERDTGLESERTTAPTREQRLHMLNSSHVRNKIEKSWRLNQLLKRHEGDSHAVARDVYLTVLSRYPTSEELDKAEALFKANGKNKRTVVDLLWALINTKEFLYRH